MSLTRARGTFSTRTTCTGSRSRTRRHAGQRRVEGGRPDSGFWLTPGNRETPQWAAHRDINDVMLATSLVPDGYLEA
jgi:hypothetical protein